MRVSTRVTAAAGWEGRPARRWWELRGGGARRPRTRLAITQASRHRGQARSESRTPAGRPSSLER